MSLKGGTTRLERLKAVSLYLSRFLPFISLEKKGKSYNFLEILRKNVPEGRPCIVLKRDLLLGRLGRFLLNLRVLKLMPLG
jgi:hypothetical protein